MGVPLGLDGRRRPRVENGRTLNPNHIDLASLRTFVAVARTGSISAGADVVHLSIPSVSKRVAELEAIVDTPLFRRTPTGVQLTPAGHSLLQHALQIQQGMERLAHDLDDFARGVTGQVRILATSSAIVQGLPGQLKSFSASHPRIRIDFEERLSGDVVRAVVQQSADIGIFTHNVPHDGLEVRPYDEDELVLIAPPDHPVAGLQEARLADVLQYDFVSQYDSTMTNNLLSLAAIHAGRTLRLRSLVRGYDSVCRLVAAGLGLGLVPASFPIDPDAVGPLAVIRLQDPWIRRRLLLGTRAGENLGVAVRALRDHLVEPPVNPP